MKVYMIWFITLMVGNGKSIWFFLILQFNSEFGEFVMASLRKAYSWKNIIQTIRFKSIC